MLTISMFALVLAACSCRDRTEHVWHPLLTKYFRGTTNEVFWVVRRDNRPVLVRQGRDRKSETALSVTHGNRMFYPEFSKALSECRIAVTNELVATDVANLLWVVMHCGPSDDFLVETATRQGNSWQVRSRYYGPPDDVHRRPGGYIHTILMDGNSVVTNLNVEALPPLVTIGAQNKSMQATPNGAPDG